MFAALIATAIAFAPMTTAPNDPELAAMLLAVDDMPTGWSVDATGMLSPTVASNGDECGIEFYGFDGADFSTASVAFATAGGPFDFNFIIETLIDTGDSDVAERLVAEFLPMSEACPSVDGGALAPMSFVDLGDATTAAVVANDEEFQIATAIVMVAVDDIVVTLFAVGDGADGRILEELATAAVERID